MLKKFYIYILTFIMVLGCSVSVAFADEESADFTDASENTIQEQVDTDDVAGEDMAEEDVTDQESDPEEEPIVSDTEYTAKNLYCQINGIWTYTLIHEYVITNNSDSVAFDIQIETPLPDGTLPDYVELDGQAFSPAAISISRDENGHQTALYNIDYMYANQSVTLTQRYIMDISALSYTFDRTDVADAYSRSELGVLAPYLYPGEGIHSTDPRIVTFTAQAVGSLTDPYQKARSIFSAVNLHLNYDADDTQDQDASAVFARGSANCQGYTNLYISCLQAAGIAAKRQNGYLYLPQQHTTDEYIDPVNGRIHLNKLRHTWVEFYLPEIGWVIADPTFTYTYNINGTVQKFVDWSFFANIDNLRRYIFFREGSLTDELINFSYTAVSNDIDVQFNAYLMPGAHLQAFNDIDGHWAQSAVTFSVSKGLFTGISQNTFAPDQAMTRAMFVTVMGRLYEQLTGEIISNDSYSSFVDVPSGSYYAAYLNWAVENELVNGYGNGRFGPNDTVTRQQMAKIISVFAQSMGSNVEIFAGATPYFSDRDKISSWAVTGIAWCNANGIITGLPGNMYGPHLSATRAQVATILQRLYEFYSLG